MKQNHHTQRSEKQNFKLNSQFLPWLSWVFSLDPIQTFPSLLPIEAGFAHRLSLSLLVLYRHLKSLISMLYLHMVSNQHILNPQPLPKLRGHVYNSLLDSATRIFNRYFKINIPKYGFRPQHQHPIKTVLWEYL